MKGLAAWAGAIALPWIDVDRTHDAVMAPSPWTVLVAAGWTVLFVAFLALVAAVPPRGDR